ncbi:MAG TPA: metallophosphoesterase [Ramlibacter sp.]|nr:metallophosphoesterase [Ramlibacter sp.]
MRIALLSDLHANRHALEACLLDARGRSADQYAFLGDLVGYGGEPGAVLDRVMDLQARGAWVLRGNHDEAALASPALGPPGRTVTGDHGAAWTGAQLSPAQREFLAGLPLVLRHDFIFLVHASANDPGQWHYVDDGRAAQASLDAACVNGVTHVFGGHVHEQRLYFQGAGRGVMPFAPTPGVAIAVRQPRRWLAAVGAVGQPRDGTPSAMYALFDTTALQLVFLRVPYDVAGAARAIRQAGLPAFYADRLAQGQ